MEIVFFFSLAATFHQCSSLTLVTVSLHEPLCMLGPVWVYFGLFGLASWTGTAIDDDKSHEKGKQHGCRVGSGVNSVQQTSPSQKLLAMAMCCQKLLHVAPKPSPLWDCPVTISCTLLEKIL